MAYEYIIVVDDLFSLNLIFYKTLSLILQTSNHVMSVVIVVTVLIIPIPMAIQSLHPLAISTPPLKAMISQY
jgi:hypothetical protein